jgi:2-methylisocitrate lyase-like PEP mutase family enzyme
MQAQDIGGAFRALHHRDRPFIIPNPWDVGTARMLQARGFEALATTSAGLAFSLGRPEGAIRRDEVLDHCRTLAQAVRVPVSADLENGYADTLEEVGETYRLAGATGLAGGSIEDARHDAEGPIYPLELAVDRVRAAVEAVRSIGRDFVLTARCENYLHGRRDLGDTIGRLQAYQEAGADVLFAPGLTSESDIRSVVGSVDRPVNVIVGSKLRVDELAAWGVKRISTGSALFRAAFGAAVAAADEMQRSGSFGYAAVQPSYAEINAMFAAF